MCWHVLFIYNFTESASLWKTRGYFQVLIKMFLEYRNNVFHYSFTLIFKHVNLLCIVFKCKVFWINNYVNWKISLIKATNFWNTVTKECIVKRVLIKKNGCDISRNINKNYKQTHKNANVQLRTWSHTEDKIGLFRYASGHNIETTSRLYKNNLTTFFY